MARASPVDQTPPEDGATYRVRFRDFYGRGRARFLVPAVRIRKSITQGYIICLEDGKRFKSLKRHLASHGMTPEQYRLKWSLPKDYPMVAADYTASRSALAKKIGLGRKVKGTGS